MTTMRRLPPLPVLIARLDHELRVAGIHNENHDDQAVSVHLGRAADELDKLREAIQ